jgi:hypothetical protein
MSDSIPCIERGRKVYLKQPKHGYLKITNSDNKYSHTFRKNNMFIQITDLAQADLLQDLDTTDTNAIVGGTNIHIPVSPVVAPVRRVSGGSVTTIGIASTGPGFAAGIGFGSASGGGFTGASSFAGASTGPGGGSIATGQGSAFTGGISGVFSGVFERL